ncbi:MAG: hypothetical protein ATN36_04980 [Epulopiscium sp. Nele67-Bin005]|nr:MAG: hypothetical protein ATN36_04980 [Epulopiscium sp. Nele67-Bin005]
MSEILLETGTGEVEIIEFIVNNQCYAINVLKVKGIIQLDTVVPLPKAAPEIMGMTNVRGNMNMVIDLQKVLYNISTDKYTGGLGLLCEFNGTIVVFLVDEVKGILKVTWADIEQSNKMKQDVLMIGSILKDGRIIILLDFESITMAADLGEDYQKQAKLSDIGKTKHTDSTIVLVEDSKAIREMLKLSLIEAGYSKVITFNNGKDAYDYMFELKDKYGAEFIEEVSILITDIEMPVLDGYTLTRRIKEDEILKNLPVIIFSSLISEELKHKGETVGADVQIGKPSIKELVEIVSKLITESKARQ